MPISTAEVLKRRIERENKIRYLKTIALFSCFMQIGLSMGIVGPTLIDLRLQTQAELTKTALVLPFRAAGYAIGAFITGLIYDYVNMQIVSFVTMFISGAMTLAVPLLTDIWVILVLFFALGLSLGLFEAGSDMFIMHIWGEKNPPYMQALHLFFGLGAFIAPTVAQPFLVPSGPSIETGEECLTDNDAMDLYTTTTMSPMNISTNGTLTENTRLIYPYGIVSLYSFLNGAVFLVVWWFWPRTEGYPTCRTEPFDLAVSSPRTGSMSLTPSIRRRHDSYISNRSEAPSIHRQFSQMSSASIRTTTAGHDLRQAAAKNASALQQGKLPTRDQIDTKDTHNQEECSSQPLSSYWSLDNLWVLTVVVITALFMHIYYGLEITFGAFLTTYTANSHLNLDTRTGASLTSVFWGSFTIWRLVTIFYMGYVGVTWTIVINLAIMLVGNVFIVPFGDTYPWTLWVGTATIGAGISPIWACMFGFLAQYMPVTSKTAAIMITSAIVGEFVFPVIIAKYIACTPMIFSWVTLACSLSIALLFVVIILICQFKLKKV